MRTVRQRRNRDTTSSTGYTYDDAEVYFDDEYKGKISGSELSVEVDPATPPYSRYSITKEGHATFTGYIDSVPAPGETIDFYPWYVQTEQPESEGVDGDRGWYVAHQNCLGVTKEI